MKWPSLPLPARPLLESSSVRLLLLKSFQWNEQSNGAISEIIPIRGDANGGTEEERGGKSNAFRSFGGREEKGRKSRGNLRPPAQKLRIKSLAGCSLPPPLGQLLAALCHSLPPSLRQGRFAVMNCPTFGLFVLCTFNKVVRLILFVCLSLAGISSFRVSLRHRFRAPLPCMRERRRLRRRLGQVLRATTGEDDCTTLNTSSSSSAARRLTIILTCPKTPDLR